MKMSEMELRDYFAAIALQGLVRDFSMEAAVENAYKVADLMLQKRQEDRFI